MKISALSLKLLLTVLVCYYFQKLEQVYVVMLRKEEGVGLGFSIAGGSDLENKDPTVSNTSALQNPNGFIFFCSFIGAKPWHNIVFQGTSHD